MIRLAGRRVMVVEDSYLLAMEVKTSLEAAGAAVLGPFATVADAQRCIGHRLPDCAVLDVNLGGGMSFDLARTLRMRRLPFLFFTGYDATALPPDFADVDRLEKPLNVAHLVRAVERCCRSVPTTC